MKLQKIIQQLDKKNYSILAKQLKEHKADKFMFLLSSYRQKPEKDNELYNKMDITPAAFYTLKSRLTIKVQEFLYKSTSDTRVELLQNVANIEHLVYKTPRETAIGILKKLENELINADMPNELIIVYRALKKLHVHSQKYYEYSALYNKSVAFNLGQDKAEDLLCSFCKTLSLYYLNRNNQLLDILVLYKREMQNICKLYESHHLHVYKNILDIHFALFSPVKKEMKNDETIENMLKETLSIIESHTQHPTYIHFVQIIDFLYFEYYHQLKLYKNASVYHEKIADNIQAVLLYNHSSFTSHFLISTIEFAIANQNENNLYTESDLQNYEANIEDKSSYILFNYYKASTEFYSNHYPETIKTLTKLLNEINFIDNPFIEIETKLFLALLYILNGMPVPAENIFRSISRKMAVEKDDIKYRLSFAFTKILKVALSSKNKTKYEKLVELNEHFNAINTGRYRVLEFIKLDETILKSLAKYEEN